KNLIPTSSASTSPSFGVTPRKRNGTALRKRWPIELAMSSTWIFVHTLEENPTTSGPAQLERQRLRSPKNSLRNTPPSCDQRTKKGCWLKWKPSTTATMPYAVNLVHRQ